MPNNCFSVIIAGGKGTRFWPLSRAGRLKQLLKILSRKSLIEETAERVYALGGRAQTLVVTITPTKSPRCAASCAICRKQFSRRASRQEHCALHRPGGTRSVRGEIPPRS